jgi:hypothetical protein
MSKSKIRKDKTCLNCNYVVENRFCPNCGQENIETRKTFHHLFIHFFEDLTHYENAFWKTIRNLIFKPGSLTREYLSGKRMSYLAPVRLYIFISFITFLTIALLPGKPVVNETEKKQGLNITHLEKNKVRPILESNPDSIYVGKFDLGDAMGFRNQRDLDSIQRYGNAEDRMSDIEYWFAKKTVNIMGNNSEEQLWEKILESMQHNFPKVLFIYMPLFAFVLFLFQSKKRWYYFDHGIFTLHYFSFLLLATLLIELLSWTFGLLGSTVAEILTSIVNFIIVIYALYYFFPAHHRFYEETRVMSIVKGVSMFIINIILAGIIMAVFLVYTFINIH